MCIYSFNDPHISINAEPVVVCSQTRIGNFVWLTTVYCRRIGGSSCDSSSLGADWRQARLRRGGRQRHVVRILDVDPAGRPVSVSAGQWPRRRQSTVPADRRRAEHGSEGGPELATHAAVDDEIQRVAQHY